MNISTNISISFNQKDAKRHQKDAKNSQFAMKSLNVYSFVFFLYKKNAYYQNIKNRIVTFSKVNKTIIK